MIIQIKYASKLFMYVQNAFYDHDFMKMYNEYNDGDLSMPWRLSQETVAGSELSIARKVHCHHQPFLCHVIHQLIIFTCPQVVIFQHLVKKTNL